MVTIQDIAKYANVSKSTVSRVLNDRSIVNERTRAAVVDAMNALGYRPNAAARTLAGGKSMTIGVMTQDIGSQFYATIGQGVISGLSDTGFSPIFAEGKTSQKFSEEAIDTLIGRQVDGLILIGGDVPQTKLDEVLNQLPTVIVTRDVDGWSERCLYIDNYSSGYCATEHLLSHGHTKIALICGIMSHMDAVQRYEGYRDALKDAGIPLNADLIHEGDFSAECGVTAINSLLSKDVNFSAVFAANDLTAFGACLGLSRHGKRVPEDVSIVGFDDQTEAAFMIPPLTTVRQPAMEMGAASAKAVVNLINNEPFELPTLPIELIVRESVRRIRT